MSWWIDNQGGIHHATAATASANAWFGPYSTKAAAEAALGRSGGASPPPADQWWVLKAVIAARGGQQLYNAVQSTSRPPDTAVSHVAAGPFATRAAADAWITSAENPLHLPNPLGWTAALAKFFDKIGQPVFWLKAAEVVVGAVLLIVGIGKMTGAGRTVVEIAKNAPKVIPV